MDKTRHTVAIESTNSDARRTQGSGIRYQEMAAAERICARRLRYRHLSMRIAACKELAGDVTAETVVGGDHTRRCAGFSTVESTSLRDRESSHRSLRAAGNALRLTREGRSFVNFLFLGLRSVSLRCPRDWQASSNHPTCQPRACHRQQQGEDQQKVQPTIIHSRSQREFAQYAYPLRNE